MPKNSSASLVELEMKNTLQDQLRHLQLKCYNIHNAETSVQEESRRRKKQHQLFELKVLPNSEPPQIHHQQEQQKQTLTNNNHQPSSNNYGFLSSNIISGTILLVTLLLSSIGCVIHIWYVSESYFAYKTSTSVSLSSESNPSLPAITICMYLKDTFNLTKYLKHFGVGKGMGEPFPMTNLSISKINELGIELDDLIIEFGTQLFGYPETSWDWKPITKSMHIARDLKCATLFNELAANLSIMSSRLSRGTLLRLKFRYHHAWFVDHFEHERLYRIYVHGPNANIGEILYGTSFEIKPSNTMIVKLSRTNTILLPAPYDTDCLEYAKETSHECRADCLDSCIVRKTTNNSASLWPREVGINLGSTEQNWSNTFISDSPLSENSTIYKECRQVDCPKVDCEQEHVGLSLVLDKVEEMANGVNASSLFIWLPTEPIYTFLHSPKISEVEYACYLGSIISLWYGISLFSSANKVYEILGKFCYYNGSRYKRNKNTTSSSTSTIILCSSNSGTNSW